MGFSPQAEGSKGFTGAMATAAGAAEIMCELPAGDEFPDVLITIQTPRVFSIQGLRQGHGLCLILVSAYHKNTQVKERAKVSPAIRCTPTPTDARTTGTGSCPSRYLPSTTQPLPWAMDPRPCSLTVVRILACSCQPKAVGSLGFKSHSLSAPLLLVLSGFVSVYSSRQADLSTFQAKAESGL